MGSNPAYRTTQFRSRRCESIGGFVFVGRPFLGRPATAGGFGGRRRTFFSVFFAFSLLACYASTPDVRGPMEMTNPIRRQIQEHPACDTHRPRPHTEGFLRRSGREVECTPLLRVQVRIRASGVRIPPSPPVSEQGSEPSSGPCFFHPLISFRNCERFCVTLRPPCLHPEANCHWRDITKNTWSCARAFTHTQKKKQPNQEAKLSRTRKRIVSSTRKPRNLRFKIRRITRLRSGFWCPEATPQNLFI